MTAVDQPFYLFFGILGLVAGGLVVWLLMAERVFETGEVRGGPIDAAEVPLLVKTLAEDGKSVDEETVSKVLELHAAYFDGRIYESLTAAESARLEAQRVQLVAAQAARREAARQEAARIAAEAAQAAEAAAASASGPRRRRSRTGQQS